MADQTQQEKVQEITRTLVDIRKPLSPEDERAEKIRQLRSSSKTATEALSILADETPIHLRRFNQVKEAVIHKSVVNPDDRNAPPTRDTDEVQKAALIDKYGQWLQTYDEKGVHDLLASMDDESKRRMYESVINIVRLLPQGDSFITDMPQEERRKIVEELLLSRDFKTYVRKLVAERTDLKKIMDEGNEGDETVRKKEHLYKEAIQVEKNKTAEVERIEKELGEIDKKLEEVKGGSRVSELYEDDEDDITRNFNLINQSIFQLQGQKGLITYTEEDKEKEYRDAKDDLDSLKSELVRLDKRAVTTFPGEGGSTDSAARQVTKDEEIGKLEDKIRSAKNEEQRLDRELKAIRSINNSLLALQTEKQNLEQKRREIHREINKDNRSESKSLQERRDSLQKDLWKVQDEKTIAENKKLSLQADYELAKLKHGSHEQDVVENLKIENIFSEAAKQYYEKEWESTVSAYDKYYEELGAKAKNKAEDALAKGLMNRWEKEKMRRRGFLWIKREKDKVPDKHRIESDFNKVMSGDKEALKSVMGGVLSSGDLSREEINQMLTDSFVKEHTSEVVADVVRNKLLIGKITPSEARYIIDSFGDDFIDQQLTRNTALKANLEKLRESNGVTENGWNWVKRKSDGSVLSFILLLLGGTFSLGMAKFLDDWGESAKR